MKSIDAEIFEVESRLHVREASLKRNAGELKTRTIKGLMSPVSIVGAVALGFLVAGGVGRRKRGKNAPAVSKETKEQSKGFAVGGLIMTALTWFMKNQFGGPVGLARFVLSKVRKDGSPAPAQPGLRQSY
jgi:hypothetical protein